jgi:amino acid transporter
MTTHSTSTKIGVATATIIGMNAMIGSGIFSAPAIMAANVGPAGILAYIIVVVSVWLMALSMARLAELFPQEGAFYTYAKVWSGHIGGLLASGAYFVGLLIAMGLLSQVAGIYLQRFFPSFTPFELGLGALFALVILNMFGVVLSQVGQHILIVCTVFPLIATTVMCLSKMNLAYLTPFAPYGFTNVFKATRIVIFGFFGFECATSLFDIVKDAQKNVPRALTYAIIFVGTLYTLFISSIILATPPEVWANTSMPVSDILKIIFPGSTWLITIIHISILSAILGTIHSMVWSSSHLLTLLVKKLKSAPAQRLVASGKLDQKAGVLLVGLCILISYCTISTPDLFFFLTAYFIVFAYVMSIISLLTVQSEWTSRRNITTLCGLATALTIFTFAIEGLVQEISKSL